MHSLFRPAAFFSIILALFAGGCSENSRPVLDASAPTTPAPKLVAGEIFPEPTAQPPSTIDTPPIAEPASQPESPVDINAIERRFLSAPNDPAARIAAIRELSNATPAAATTLLNRLFPIERREDVKSEMLAALGDLDHTKERDNQLALCTKALAASQPMRVRYIAIHTLVDLHDPRARGILIPLQNDPDREIRAAANQALSDLAQ